MLYTLVQGPTEKFIVEQSVRNKTPLPAAILNAPFLLWGLEATYLAFNDLSTCRQLGYGAEGPIPWWCVDQWCERYKIRGIDREDFEYLIREMDTAYLQHRAETAKQSAKAPAGAGRRVVKVHRPKDR